MRKAINTGLPEFGRPTEHATISGGHVCTTAVPLKADGTFETGDPSKQINLVLCNLKQTMAAAGGDLNDVLQALVFLTGPEHVPVLNQVWRDYFEEPFPNRGIIIVNAIGVPDIIILIQVQAHIAEGQ